jgi:hypothetical protein
MTAPPPPIRKWRAKQPRPGVCRGCGCTEARACVGGCAWADDSQTLCTTCQPWTVQRANLTLLESRDRRPTVVLVGCGLRKLPHAAPAWELYQGPLYRSALAYARALGAPWFILSALHGVVEGEAVMSPYDTRIQRLSLPERQAWAVIVARKLMRVLPHRRGDRARVVVLAGSAYVTPWRDEAVRHGWQVLEPLAHVHPNGKRMQWLNVRPPQDPEGLNHA